LFSAYMLVTRVRDRRASAGVGRTLGLMYWEASPIRMPGRRMALRAYRHRFVLLIQHGDHLRGCCGGGLSLKLDHGRAGCAGRHPSLVYGVLLIIAHDGAWS